MCIVFVTLLYYDSKSYSYSIFHSLSLSFLLGKSTETDEAGIMAVSSVTSEARILAQAFSPEKRFAL